MRRNRLLSMACCLTALAVQAGAALAESFPQRAITIVDAYPAGGSSDVLSRILGEQLTKQTGQSVIVTARPGATGTIGASYVSRSKPDGYTLFVGNPGPNAIAASTYSKLPYDVDDGFTPITLAAVVPMLLCVGADSKVQTPQDLVELGKSSSQPTVGSAGVGSMSHIVGEMLNYAAGAQFMHVPYKGASPLIVAIMSGEIDAGVLTGADAHPHVQSGKMRCVGNTGTERSPLFPNVPTFAEAGISGVEAELWYGYLAPPKTPDAIVQSLLGEFTKALSQPAIRDRLTEMGMTVRATSPDEFAARIRSDKARYGEIVNAIGLKLD